MCKLKYSVSYTFSKQTIEFIEILKNSNLNDYVNASLKFRFITVKMQRNDKKILFFCFNIFTTMLVLLYLFYNGIINFSNNSTMNFYKIPDIKPSTNSYGNRSFETLNAVEIRDVFSKAHVLSYSLFGNNWERYGKAVEEVAKEAFAN